MKKYIAEAIGTFALVFSGCGAIVVNDAQGGAITHVGIALSFGLVVMAMIYSVGDVSGAHLNPAVSIGFWLAKRFDLKELFPFISAQFVGALAAALVLRILFPNHDSMGATFPAAKVAWWQAFVFEVILTFLLMYVILNVSTGAKEKGIMAGAAIGGTVALCAMFGGPICGASMNPARSLGPAMIAGRMEFQWIYVLAPIIGAAIAVPACYATRDDGNGQSDS